MPENTTVDEKIKFLDWIGKNMWLSLAVLFAITTGYMFMQLQKCQSESKIEVKHLQEVIGNMQEKNLEYEKTRSSRLEFLLEHLPKDETTTK